MNLSRFILAIATLSSCVIASFSALADTEIRTTVGYGVYGRFQAGSLVAVDAIPIALALQWEPRFLGSNVMLGGTFKHQILSYHEAGALYSGSDLLAGAAFGFNLYRDRPLIVRVEGAYYPYNVMTMASETSASVNGQAYKQSSLSIYQGPGAYEARTLVLWESDKGHFNRHERLRYGFALTYFVQPITSWELTTAASNADIAPRKTDKQSVDYSLTIMSTEFSVGFAF